MEVPIEALQSLGIDEKQAQVYLAGLELGAATVQELSKKSGIKRTSIYNFVDELKELGLFTVVENGKRVQLVPSDPQLLVKRSESTVRKIEAALPEMLGMYNQPGNKPKTRYFEGIDGLMKMYDDILSAGETVYAFSDYEKMFQAMDEQYMWKFATNRAQRGIRFYGIAKSGKDQLRVAQTDEDCLREQRTVGDLPFDTEVNIYGGKVSFFSFRRPYAGVIIEDRAIATTMKTIWKLVWEGLEVDG